MTGRGKGGKGLGKGGAKRHRKVLRDNIQVGLSFLDPPDLSLGHHQACHPAPRQEGRRQEDLWPHLRGDQGRPQGLPRERDPRRRDLHRARQEEDRHRHGRRLRPQAPGTYPVRIRRLDYLTLLDTSFSPTNQTQGPF